MNRRESFILFTLIALTLISSIISIYLRLKLGKSILSEYLLVLLIPILLMIFHVFLIQRHIENLEIGISGMINDMDNEIKEKLGNIFEEIIDLRKMETIDCQKKDEILSKLEKITKI